MNEQPDKETPRLRSGRVPNAGASVLLEFGAQLKGYGSSLVPQPGNSLKPILLEFYGSFISQA